MRDAFLLLLGIIGNDAFLCSKSILLPRRLDKKAADSDEHWNALFRDVLSEEALWTSWHDRQPLVFRDRIDFVSDLNVRSIIEGDASIVTQAARVDFDLDRGLGWMNQALENEAWADVETALEERTVLFNSAGLAFPQAAWACAAASAEIALPVGGNVYLTRPGTRRSAPAHTDRQDVFAVQVSGFKRWRVAKPPAIVDAQLDPFARGKGDDTLLDHELDWLLDTVLKPGDILFIPAGCPHETSTALDVDCDALSVHLTLGAVSGTTWGLSFLTLARLALSAVPHTKSLRNIIINDHLLRRDAVLHDALHRQLPIGKTGLMLSSSSVHSLIEEQVLLASIRDSPILSRVFVNVPESVLLSAFKRIQIHHKELLLQMERAYRVDDWATTESFATRLDTHIDTLAGLIDNLYDWSYDSTVSPTALPRDEGASKSKEKSSSSKRRRRRASSSSSSSSRSEPGRGFGISSRSSESSATTTNAKAKKKSSR